MIPPLSPYGLIQESLWPDEWKILVSCMMLNCTTRKQAEKVLPTFFSKWPTAQDFLSANHDEVSEVISSLGFKNRRTKNLFNMSQDYVNKKWTHAKELPGIGEYASRAWEIFYKGILRDTAPEDGALVLYWKWRKQHGN